MRYRMGAGVAGVMVALVVIASAPSRGAGPEKRDADGETELFRAIERGDVEAKVIVRDQFHARLILKNQTTEPVVLRLPDMFAARPILAQQGFNFGNPGGSGNQSQKAPQAVSGPMAIASGQQNLQGNQNGQNNIFNIPPERVRSISIECFCIEHGKPNPRAIIPYELVEFEKVGGDAILQSVLSQYAGEDVDRDAAQAAVWHVTNKKSWDELRGMTRRIAINADEPIFTARQMQIARNLVAKAERYAAELAKRKPTTFEGRSIAESKVSTESGTRYQTEIRARR